MWKFWRKCLYLEFPLAILHQTVIESSSHWPKVIWWSVGHCDLPFSNLGHIKTLMQGSMSISDVSFHSYWPNFNRTFLSYCSGGAVVERPPRMRKAVSSNPGRVITKTWKMVVAALSLGAQHYGSRATTGRPGVSKMWPGEISGRLSGAWYFSGAAL